MLQQIRDRAQSWIAIAIVGMLIIGLSTVAWDAYFSPDPELPVAKVNGEKISSREFQNAYQQQRNRLQNMLGGGDISQLIPDETEFKQNVLKRLIEEEVVYQAAVDAGYRVSDGLLAQQIRSFDVFQRDGQFDPALYQQWLSQNFMSAGMFEDMLRRDVIIQQYRLAVVATGWSTEQENRRLFALREQRRDVGYVTVPAKDYLDQVTVTEDRIRAYYDENPTRFSTPEQVSIRYLELSMADLVAHVDVDDARLRELYNDRQAEFGVPEERRTRHIMIELRGDESDEEIKAAREKSESLYRRIQEGASFETLAREHSDDIGSAGEGGDLGYMSRDTMLDPAMADAAFALAEGEVSRPVRSAFGFHLIKIDEIKTGQAKPFEEVRGQLLEEYRRRQAEDRFFEDGEMLANLTFENPDTLEVAAQELGLDIKESVMFSRERGTGIANNPLIRSTAFSDDVLRQGFNSEVLEDGDRRIVLRVDKHLESSVRPFDEVKAEITDLLRQQQAQRMAEEAGREILDILAGGARLEDVAREHGLTWTHPAPLGREARGIDVRLVQSIFRMPRPQGDGTTYEGVRMSNGDYAVAALYQVSDGDMESAEAGRLASVRTDRERYYGALELLGAMQGLRRSAEVREYPENL